MDRLSQLLALLLVVTGRVESHGGGAHKPKGPKIEVAKSKLPPEPEQHKLFEAVEEGVRRQVHSMLHTVTTKQPLKLATEVQVLLLGFDGAGGYGYEGFLNIEGAQGLGDPLDGSMGARRVKLDEVQLSLFLSKAYRSHQPFCMVRTLASPEACEPDRHSNLFVT
jgi:hypothetical protein